MRAGALTRRPRYFERAETARKGDLRVISDVLIAKHQNRMLFERGAHSLISGFVMSDVGERRTAQIGGKAGA